MKPTEPTPSDHPATDETRRRRQTARRLVLVPIFSLLFLFSFFLMFRTFSYDAGTRDLLISSKAWSDFGAHIPLIRSFSLGDNLSRLIHIRPVESPLYPGEPIRYHYGFYMLVGLLERLGIRIDWAFNIPSALGFFALMLMIFLVARALFADTATALLSILFFLFNGSLSFLVFLSKHPITDVFTNSRFPSFGPWDGGMITAFWNLNIYTNQRHLAASYALALFLVLLVLSPKGKRRIIGIALAASILLFTNYAVAGITAIMLGWIFLVKKETRSTLFTAGILSIPAFIFLHNSADLTSRISYHPGYLIPPPLTVPLVVAYWFQNIGLHLFFIPLALFLMPKSSRIILLGPILILSVVPNLFQFSADMINNHKFFNFVMILGVMCSAYAIMTLWRRTKRHRSRIVRYVGALYAGISVLILTASGFVDIFPVINDYYGRVPDVDKDSAAYFFVTQTNPGDIIANSTWFYHPASIAGRAIYSGYTYFTWSYGYDQQKREDMLRNIYQASDRTQLCLLLRQNAVSFIELDTHPESYLAPNWELFRSLPSVYSHPGQRTIYSTKNLCSQSPTP